MSIVVTTVMSTRNSQIRLLQHPTLFCSHLSTESKLTIGIRFLNHPPGFGLRTSTILLSYSYPIWIESPQFYLQRDLWGLWDRFYLHNIYRVQYQKHLHIGIGANYFRAMTIQELDSHILFEATMEAPTISRSVTLNFVGDWGQANFHRICSWLTQQFCDRAGPRSRTAIWSLRDGGLDSIQQVHDGEADLCIATPAKLMAGALTGEGIFKPMPNLRTLAVLPQRDRMMLAIDPKFQINSFEELRKQKPPLRIATSANDGTNFIGYVAMRLMKAHGVDIEAWGGSYVLTTRPEQAIENMRLGKADAVLQEAIMTPWWRGLMDHLVPISMEPEAFTLSEPGFELVTIRAGFWDGVEEVKAAEFSDFLVVVRDDMPDDVAGLLTWCLVETRADIESQYLHIPPERSPLTYPLDPRAMAKPSIPLHPAAKKYYEAAGYLDPA